VRALTLQPPLSTYPSAPLRALGGLALLGLPLALLGLLAVGLDHRFAALHQPVLGAEVELCPALLGAEVGAFTDTQGKDRPPRICMTGDQKKGA